MELLWINDWYEKIAKNFFFITMQMIFIQYYIIYTISNYLLVDSRLVK